MYGGSKDEFTCCLKKIERNNSKERLLNFY